MNDSGFLKRSWNFWLTALCIRNGKKSPLLSIHPDFVHAKYPLVCHFLKLAFFHAPQSPENEGSCWLYSNETSRAPRKSPKRGPPTQSTLPCAELSTGMQWAFLATRRQKSEVRDCSSTLLSSSVTKKTRQWKLSLKHRS